MSHLVVVPDAFPRVVAAISDDPIRGCEVLKPLPHPSLPAMLRELTREQPRGALLRCSPRDRSRIGEPYLAAPRPRAAQRGSGSVSGGKGGLRGAGRPGVCSKGRGVWGEGRRGTEELGIEIPAGAERVGDEGGSVRVTPVQASE